MDNARTASELPPLRGNGLIASDDFPVVPYESIYEIVVAKQAGHPAYEHFAGAWNALAYRYKATVDSGEALVASFKAYGLSPQPSERYGQERLLFEFFSSGFSVFESLFYGLFALGVFLDPKFFSLLTAKDQQMVTPSRTKAAFVKAFPGDVILNELDALLADTAYQRWREIRNVLTHRAAPGRTMYVSLGDDDLPPTEWKLTRASLGDSVVVDGRRDLSRLMSGMLSATDIFVRGRIS